MRIAKARVKSREEFPEVEFCCQEALEIMQNYFGIEIEVDLDDTSSYCQYGGHCGQKLPYIKAVAVVNDKREYYVPFDLIHLDEGSL